MDIKSWQELKNKFKLLYKRCSKTPGCVDIGFIAPIIIQAGEDLNEYLEFYRNNNYDLVDELQNIPSFPFPLKLESKSCTITRYGSFWLWILVFEGLKNNIDLVNPDLRKLFFHKMEMGELLEELQIDAHLTNRHKKYDTGYIFDICLGSQQLCELIIMTLNQKNKKWHPKPDTIGSKVIVNVHKIPRSTLQYWEKKDIKEGKLKNEIDRDPITQEKYYPERWIKDRILKHKSRTRKNHS